MTQIQEFFDRSLEFLGRHPWAEAGVILLLTVLVAMIADLIFKRVFIRVTAKTRSTIDDQIVASLHRPIFTTALLIGLYYAAKSFLEVYLDEADLRILRSVLFSLALLMWVITTIRLSTLILKEMAYHPKQSRIVQPATYPIFNFLSKVIFVGAGIYLAFLIWNLNPSAWVTSAGVIGITLGFAARDTIANFFAGVFILADNPYKIGDYIVLDTGERGKVTNIGLRSTRILTRDDVEVTIPNSVIANAKITNESGGPAIKHRIRVPVGVSYDSDIDEVRGCLQQAASEDFEVCPKPEPRVRFRGFGESSLDFELLCWIDEPEWRGRVKDRLLSAIFKDFSQRGIEIPYPKRDIFIRQDESQANPPS